MGKGKGRRRRGLWPLILPLWQSQFNPLKIVPSLGRTRSTRLFWQSVQFHAFQIFNAIPLVFEENTWACLPDHVCLINLRASFGEANLSWRGRVIAVSDWAPSELSLNSFAINLLFCRGGRAQPQHIFHFHGLAG